MHFALATMSLKNENSILRVSESVNIASPKALQRVSMKLPLVRSGTCSE